MSSLKPTESELDILAILWEDPAAQTVRQVHDRLSRDRDVVYTTTLKLMQIMLEKGLVKRDTSQRSHRYQAAVARKPLQRRLLGELVDRVFGGSTEQLIMQAISARKLSSREMAEIQALLEEQKGDA